MSDRREDDGWKDVEEGDSEEKAHPRSISRILPDGLPSIVLSKIDDCDEVSLSAIQLMLRSPTFRLIILLYFSLLNIGFVCVVITKEIVDCLFLEHVLGFIILNDYYKAMKEKQSFLQDSVEHISPDVDPEGNGKGDVPNLVEHN